MNDLTYADVVRILNLIDASADVNAKVKLGKLSIKLKCAGAELAPRSVAALAPTGQKPIPVPAAAVAATIDSATALAKFPDATPVLAPMSGVFYCAPGVGKPAFVEIGQKVEAGDQLGIVEVMKLFTPLITETDGTVVAILVNNQQNVTKDDLLMLIEESLSTGNNAA